jgi:hypothetical protein
VMILIQVDSHQRLKALLKNRTFCSDVKWKQTLNGAPEIEGMSLKWADVLSFRHSSITVTMEKMASVRFKLHCKCNTWLKFSVKGIDWKKTTAKVIDRMIEQGLFSLQMTITNEEKEEWIFKRIIKVVTVKWITSSLPWTYFIIQKSHSDSTTNDPNIVTVMERSSYVYLKVLKIKYPSQVSR